MLDEEKTPFLFSVGTELAYKIAKRYYKSHYVWCSPFFDNRTQAVTSNPASICNQYLSVISTGDRHSEVIDNNKAGILTGATKKYEAGIIDKKQLETIQNAVAAAEYSSFMPVVYVIMTSKIKNKCCEVFGNEKASDESIEYRIEDLQPDEFQLIDIKNVVNGIVDIADKFAGE